MPKCKRYFEVPSSDPNGAGIDHDPLLDELKKNYGKPQIRAVGKMMDRLESDRTTVQNFLDEFGATMNGRVCPDYYWFAKQRAIHDNNFLSKLHDNGLIVGRNEPRYTMLRLAGVATGVHYHMHLGSRRAWKESADG